MLAPALLALAVLWLGTKTVRWAIRQDRTEKQMTPLEGDSFRKWMEDRL
jgi:hypothetical protein